MQKGILAAALIAVSLLAARNAAVAHAGDGWFCGGRDPCAGKCGVLQLRSCFIAEVQGEGVCTCG